MTDTPVPAAKSSKPSDMRRASARAADGRSITGEPSASAKSRTRRSSRPATRGVPRERLAISRAPSSLMPTPSLRAAPVMTRTSSSGV